MTESTRDRSLVRTVLMRTVQLAIAAGLVSVVGLFAWNHLMSRSADKAKAARRPKRDESVQRSVNWRQVGDQAYVKRQWNKAAAAYRQVLRRNPENLPALVRLAYSLHSAGRLDEALQADVLASRSPYARSWALYNIACIYAVKRERELALDYLRQAIEAGFRSERPLREDPDFASLVGDADFQRLEQLAKPMKLRNAYHRMDFLLGRWILMEHDKQRDGTFELHRDVSGYGLAGSFLNNALPLTVAVTAYYDPSVEKWRQLWLDGRGGVIDLMQSSASSTLFVLDGNWLKPNGDRNPARLALTINADQSITLVLSESRDSRQTWDKVVKTKLIRVAERSAVSNGTTSSGRLPFHLR